MPLQAALEVKYYQASSGNSRNVSIVMPLQAGLSM